MPERIKITVRASGAHPDVLTVQDAMRQVVDCFELLDRAPGVEWKLTQASTNSPFYVEGEAISLEPSVDVSVVARAQKSQLAKNLQELTHGRPPISPDFNVKAARRVLARNQNGVGLTEIDLEIGEPFKVTPRVAREATEVLDNRPVVIFDMPSPREEIGSIEGALQDVGTHYNYPAARIIEAKTGEEIWCRLSEELQNQLQDKASYQDVWRHKRVIVRGRIKYNADGEIAYVLASDIQRIEDREVSLEQIKDRDFTQGLSVVEYLDRFRDGALG